MRPLVFSLLCIANVCIPGAATGQIADYYRGTVANAQAPSQSSTLELSIFRRTDTSTVGWLKVGTPQRGTGVAGVVYQDHDSLYLVSTSKEGDTTVWASETRTGAIGGHFWVSGGPHEGASGRWRLTPRARISSSTLAAISLVMSLAVLSILYLGAVYLSDRWWAWREARPMAGVSDAQRREWSAIGGWLAWITFAQSMLLIYLLITSKEIWSTFEGGWMVGAAAPGMRVLLVIESAAHALQINGVAIGLLLIFRKSSIAPIYWAALLVTMALYALFDVIATATMMPSFAAAFGAKAASEFQLEAGKAERSNVRLIVSALAWSLYWLRSRRVRLVFAPRRSAAAESARSSVQAPSPALPVSTETSLGSPTEKGVTVERAVDATQGD